jgi:hypothetical protein
MWTSKLGNKYERAWIEAHHASAQADLKRMRGMKDKRNDRCADCNQHDTTWASVSHGTFICITCSDVHRSVGTHISKVKGCTGTYYWGPDEIERMSGGNFAAECSYGTQKISPDASKEEKQRYVINKYDKRLFGPTSGTTLAPTVEKGSRPQTEVGSVSLGGTSVSVAVVQTFSEKLPPARPIASSIPENVFDELFHDWETSPKANTPGTVTKSAMESHGAVCMLPDDLFVNVEGSGALPLGRTLGVQGESNAPPDCALQEGKFVNALDDVDDIFAVLRVA